MHSALESEKVLKEVAIRTLWDRIVNVGDKWRGKKKRDAERARYTSRRRLLVEHLENNGG